MGFRRAARYFGYRVLRLPGSAYAIAGGFAWGAAISFTPFIGLHIVISALAAWISRCSIIASAIGTVVGNPWTFPFIWGFIYRVGGGLLGMDAEEAPALETLSGLFREIWHLAGNWILLIVGLEESIETGKSGEALWIVIRTILWPMFVGSLPTALIVWLVFYLPLRRLVEGYQSRRRRRRHGREAKIAGAPDGDVSNI